jgi:predicted NAD/FAD-binding protein
MRIAIVGTGVSGLICAHVLAAEHEVTLFEADDRPGGHAHTVHASVDGRSVPVDTGFLVYNERTYPGLVRLFDELGVGTQPSDMSFSVVDERTGLEYGGTRPGALFAQRANLLRPAFLRMLTEVLRFHRAGRALLEDPPQPTYTLEDFLSEGTWSTGFVEWFLVPLGSSIWSADPQTFLQMPATMVLRFFERHGMLTEGQKPAWRTVSGGSVNYVDAIVAPFRRAGRLRLSSPVARILRTETSVEVKTSVGAAEQFDHVILATHSDQALGVLADATKVEKEVLGAIRYQDNSAVLHTDPSLLPSNRRAWAAWNFHRPSIPLDHVTMTYYLNRLQGLEVGTPVLVTLNRDEEIDPAAVLETFTYAHPILDTEAIAAQARHHEISGVDRLSFCGAYWGSGFHEDGLQSALEVCRVLGVRW